MIRYYELNEEQLLTLTDDEVKRLVDYECAIEGVPMLPPHPGPAPECAIPEPDVQCYEVGGVITTDPEHAARIITAITSGPMFSANYCGKDYHTRYLTPILGKSYNQPKIESGVYRSAEQWDKIKDENRLFEEKKTVWDNLDKEYAEALKARDHISEAVWDAISEARTKKRERENITTEFTTYKDLAQGDLDIAMNFMLKAKPSMSEKYPELIQQLCPGYGEPKQMAAE